VGDLEIYFPDKTALHFTSNGVSDHDSEVCDGCNTRQFTTGGIMSDQIFVCAKCRVIDRNE